MCFDIESTEFTQILHNGHDHWLTISTIGAQEAEIFVFVSLYPSASSCVKRQIAALLATKLNVITLKHIDVQIQSGTYDCGLFVITFATLSAVKDWFLFVYARRTRTVEVQIEY